MRINIQAAATRGQTPFANREVTIEKDGDNVFLAFPQASGVVSNDSAVAIGDGILETAGFAAPESNDNIPAGWLICRWSLS